VISGAHVIVYSKNAEADRAFLRDILRFPHVDVGGGWLIFGLPPSEVAVHPSDGDGGDAHELFLMCDDVEEFRAEMERQGIATSPAQNRGWGVLTEVALPGGSKLGVYQPRHERPAPTGGSSTASARSSAGARSSRKPARKPAGKPANKPARRGSKKSPAKRPAARTSAAHKPRRR
jgi:hypothetical protein